MHDFPERLASELRDRYPFQDGYSPVAAGLFEVPPWGYFQARQGAQLRRDSPVLRDALLRHDCLPPEEHPGLVQLRSGRAYRPSLLRLVATVQLAPAARPARCEPVEERHYGRRPAPPPGD